jgi:hypothetical protein
MFMTAILDLSGNLFTNSRFALLTAPSIPGCAVYRYNINRHIAKWTNARL